MNVTFNSKDAKLLAGKFCFTRYETTVLTNTLSVLKFGGFFNSVAFCSTVNKDVQSVTRIFSF